MKRRAKLRGEVIPYFDASRCRVVLCASVWKKAFEALEITNEE
jgi:hypothetical protein